MKILITGGAGFIGSHIVEKLKNEGHVPIVLDNLSTGSISNIPSNVKFLNMDVNDCRLSNVLKEEKIEMVIHLAGQTMVKESINDPVNDMKQNIEGTLNLLESIKKNNIKRIIFSSSAAVYGNVNEVDLPILESYDINPMSFYGLSKATVEKYLKLYNDVFGLNYIIFRFSNVYGERQGNNGEGGVISIFSKNLSHNKKIYIFGDGNQTRDFIYVGDIVNAIYLSLFTENINTVYNLSNQNECSLRDIIKIFEKILGRKIYPEYKNLRNGDIYRSQLSNKKARLYLKWEPKISLDKGLLVTLRYFMNFK